MITKPSKFVITNGYKLIAVGIVYNRQQKKMFRKNSRYTNQEETTSPQLPTHWMKNASIGKAGKGA